MSRKLVSKKRTSAAANDDDEQTNEDSDGLFQQEDNAKRARLASLSDTTLQDLPIELIECILIKVVAMEVKNMKLAKSVWKEKAELVINRLAAVCLQWSSVLATDGFRTRLHRALEGPEKIRLEMLHEFSTPSQAIDFITSLKDEIFTLEERNEVHVIRVYDRNNTARVTDVIPLEKKPEYMEACNVSNCIYVGLRNGDYSLSVIHISKDGDGQFVISPWTINDPQLSIFMIYVLCNGNLMIYPIKNAKVRNVIICDAKGFLLREVKLPPGISASVTTNAIQISNGNLVMVYTGEYDHKHNMNLLEIDVDGSVVRRHESEVLHGFVNFADIYGRIVIIDEDGGSMQLLDFEFNLIGIYGFQQDEDKLTFVTDVHFTSERNEIVCTLCDYYDDDTMTNKVTIFRFTEE